MRNSPWHWSMKGKRKSTLCRDPFAIYRWQHRVPRAGSRCNPADSQPKAKASFKNAGTWTPLQECIIHLGRLLRAILKDTISWMVQLGVIPTHCASNRQVVAAEPLVSGEAAELGSCKCRPGASAAAVQGGKPGCAGEVTRVACGCFPR